MTLGDMCLMAARYADRYDEFVKSANAQGEAAYQGEALNMFNVMRDAINEAYAEISDGYLLPDRYEAVTPDAEGLIDLTQSSENAISVIDVLTEDGRRLPFAFRTRFVLSIKGISPGEGVRVRLRIQPERLKNEDDAPIFPDAAASPMIYVSLAVARLFQSERKFSDAQSWLLEYRRLIRSVRSGARTKRRLPRPPFR